jgi:hypothetical protein
MVSEGRHVAGEDNDIIIDTSWFLFSKIPSPGKRGEVEISDRCRMLGLPSD